MNIYIYSDESGVFDKKHNDYFVFGGIICIGTNNKNIWSRKYAAAEKALRKNVGIPINQEMKACFLKNKQKHNLYRLLNNCYKFGAIISQQKIMDRIFKSKKDKQRYLDYAYKISVKNALLSLINKGIIKPKEIEYIYFYVDEHTTATNGRYELREGLEQELKLGTYNLNYDHFFPPILPDVNYIELKFCNSASEFLIRAADIVANHFYYIALNQKCNYKYDIEQRNAFITKLP